MALIRWEPTREVASLQGEVNRLFNSFFDHPAEGSVLRRWLPPMDLVDDSSSPRQPEPQAVGIAVVDSGDCKRWRV